MGLVELCSIEYTSVSNPFNVASAGPKLIFNILERVPSPPLIRLVFLARCLLVFVFLIRCFLTLCFLAFVLLCFLYLNDLIILYREI